jgi:hypothetical protein
MNYLLEGLALKQRDRSANDQSHEPVDCLLCALFTANTGHQLSLAAKAGEKMSPAFDG